MRSAAWLPKVAGSAKEAPEHRAISERGRVDQPQPRPPPAHRVYRIESGKDANPSNTVAILATGHHQTKEHNVTTMEIELIDAALSAPAGLDGLAADMADLATQSTKGRFAHPSNLAARRAARYWRRLRDARVNIEPVNALAGKWEQVGRLCVAARASLRPAPRIGSSPCATHNHPRR